MPPPRYFSALGSSGSAVEASGRARADSGRASGRVWEDLGVPKNRKVITKTILYKHIGNSSSRKLRWVIYYTLYRMDPQKQTNVYFAQTNTNKLQIVKHALYISPLTPHSYRLKAGPMYGQTPDQPPQRPLCLECVHALNIAAARCPTCRRSGVGRSLFPGKLLSKHDWEH